MVGLFGVGCYVTSASSSSSSTGGGSCEKMVVIPQVQVKFSELRRLFMRPPPPSIGDCLYDKPKHDVLLVTNVHMCKMNVSHM